MKDTLEAGDKSKWRGAVLEKPLRKGRQQPFGCTRLKTTLPYRLVPGDEHPALGRPIEIQLTLAP
eukprot:4422682-Amphidinium_carterae.1